MHLFACETNECIQFTSMIPAYICSSKVRSERAVQLLFRLFLSLYVSTLVSLEVFHILPALFPTYGTTFTIYSLLGTYFLIGFVYNAIQVVLKDPSIRGMMLVNKVTRQWTYCVSCQTPRPPRTHHCHVCDTCVLRRDHHCVLLAQCIGWSNWRHFFSLLIFGTMGAGLASRFNLPFVFSNQFAPDDWSVGFRLLCLVSPPGAFWILGQITLLQTLVFTMTTTCLLFSCLLFVFSCYYLMMISCNQTLSDRMARSKALTIDPASRTSETEAILANTGANLYDVGWRANISQYLGEHWVLAVLFPFTTCIPTTDGLSFPRSDSAKIR